MSGESLISAVGEEIGGGGVANQAEEEGTEGWEEQKARGCLSQIRKLVLSGPWAGNPLSKDTEASPSSQTKWWV